jgi:hypothetical protein
MTATADAVIRLRIILRIVKSLIIESAIQTGGTTRSRHDGACEEIRVEQGTVSF